MLVALAIRGKSTVLSVMDNRKKMRLSVMWQALYSLTKQNPWNHKVKMLNSNSFKSRKQGNENIFFGKKSMDSYFKRLMYQTKSIKEKAVDFLITPLYH